MRLTVPEPKIDLYNDGFEPGRLDQLGRKETGDKLSDLVERIDDPLVIALDGAWGSGNSFFLKCWVGEHLKRQGNTTQTVYFDAFKHDFLDDPLIALTDAIATRLEKDENLPPAERITHVEKLKKFGWVLGKSSAKIGVSVAGHYAKKLVGEECLEEFGKELEKASEKGVATLEGEVTTLIDSGIGKEEAETFWREQRAKIVAMAAFREVLAELTEPNEDGEPTRKLVIVVDELDRCRPDYALSLLEIIKHFFNVDGVHFVLGVNLKELQNSVRARYGSGVDAEKYLQKFFTIKTKLSDRQAHSQGSQPIYNYFLTTCGKMNLDDSTYYNEVKSYISRMQWNTDFSVRSLHSLMSIMALATQPKRWLPQHHDAPIVAGLLVLQAFDPKTVSMVRNGSAELQDIGRTLSFEDPYESSGQELRNWISWRACYAGGDDTMLRDHAGHDFEYLVENYDRDRVKALLEDCLDVFTLPKPRNH